MPGTPIEKLEANSSWNNISLESRDQYHVNRFYIPYFRPLFPSSIQLWGTMGRKYGYIMIYPIYIYIDRYIYISLSISYIPHGGVPWFPPCRQRHFHRASWRDPKWCRTRPPRPRPPDFVGDFGDRGFTTHHWRVWKWWVCTPSKWPWAISFKGKNDDSPTDLEVA